MIIKCKICNGSGHAGIQGMFQESRVCPACNGSGEFEVNRESIDKCNFCRGSGLRKPWIKILENDPPICPVCKGKGFKIRQKTESQAIERNEIKNLHSIRQSDYDFDIAVSFAGEDRKVVSQYSHLLELNGLKVFYDKNEQADLWGKNLFDKLDEVYRTKALYCVLFISKHYAEKVWTNHERKSAQARAFTENREYVLPVRLDNTEIPGILPTIGYIDLREASIEELAEISIKKVNQLKNKTHKIGRY